MMVLNAREIFKYVGFGQTPFHHFKVDKNEGKCLGPGCGGEVAFVDRDRGAYGNIVNLDPLLDQVDAICSVSLSDCITNLLLNLTLTGHINSSMAALDISVSTLGSIGGYVSNSDHIFWG